jgi:hypothetical protein
MPRTPRPTVTTHYRNRTWADWSDSPIPDPHREAYDPKRSPFTLPLANYVADLLPGLGMPAIAIAGSQHARAPWPVWRDSTTKKVKFAPLPKKKAVALFHKARQFERQTRQPGKQDGALGRNGLAVLHALIFDFLDYMTGELDPAIKSIAQKACTSVASVKRGLRNLKHCGVLNWIRRAAETRDEKGRFCLEQDTNAYGILPPSQWLGFIDRPAAPPPDPSTWGATLPLPSVTEQAIIERREGASDAAIIKRLEDDPGDELAAALAGLGRAIQERAARENRNENR